MSIQPVLAAVVGLVLLRQPLRAHEWVGIAVVVTVNSATVASAHRTGPPAGAEPRPAEELLAVSS